MYWQRRSLLRRFPLLVGARAFAVLVIGVTAAGLAAALRVEAATCAAAAHAIKARDSAPRATQQAPRPVPNTHRALAGSAVCAVPHGACDRGGKLGRGAGVVSQPEKGGVTEGGSWAGEPVSCHNSRRVV